MEPRRCALADGDRGDRLGGPPADIRAGGAAGGAASRIAADLGTRKKQCDLALQRVESQIGTRCMHPRVALATVRRILGWPACGFPPPVSTPLAPVERLLAGRPALRAWPRIEAEPAWVSRSARWTADDGPAQLIAETARERGRRWADALRERAARSERWISKLAVSDRSLRSGGGPPRCHFMKISRCHGHPDPRIRRGMLRCCATFRSPSDLSP